MPNELPEGWDEASIKAVIEHYESQSDEEAIAEAETAFASAETTMQVPLELVPQVRALIAKWQAEQSD